MEQMAPAVFIFFFTLVGIEMNLDVLREAAWVILVLWLARLGGVFAGSFLGGTAARDPLRQNALLGFTFITQAGVSVGLAQEVGVEFGAWGTDFATLSIAVIVLNQFVGPPFFKWAIRMAGEAHPPASSSDFDGERDVLIFGMGSRERALTRRLVLRGWNVRLVCLAAQYLSESGQESDGQIVIADEITPVLLDRLGAQKADAVVAMLPDDEMNYHLCELIFEHAGTRNVVVYVREPANIPRFQDLGISIVEPTTAVVSLLEHFVRAPASTSLLLGEDTDQEVAELPVRAVEVEGIAVRDLHLPSDVLILSIRRGSETLVSHGYTRLKIGDHVTVFGSPQSIEHVEMRFDGLRLPEPALDPEV